MKSKRRRIAALPSIKSPRIAHKSKTELVYETLKKAIIDGKWKTGTQIDAKAVACSLRVSRTPVLEACRLLQTEGLLKIRPQVGIEVTTLSQEGIEEVFYIRGALSGLATEHACGQFGKADLQRLRNLVEKMDRCLPEKNYLQFSKLNREFHYSIFKKCNLPHLMILLSRYWDSGSRYAHLFDQPQMMAASVKEHHEILEALAAGDAAKARHMAEKNSVRFGLEMAKFLKQAGMSEPQEKD